MQWFVQLHYSGWCQLAWLPMHAHLFSDNCRHVITAARPAIPNVCSALHKMMARNMLNDEAKQPRSAS